MTIGVLAGSRVHFNMWFREVEKSPITFVYLDREQMLRGIEYNGYLWLTSHFLNPTYTQHFKDMMRFALKKPTD